MRLKKQMQKLLACFFSKNISVFAIFDDQSFNATSLVLNKWALILVYEEHSMGSQGSKAFSGQPYNLKIKVTDLELLCQSFVFKVFNNACFPDNTTNLVYI